MPSGIVGNVHYPPSRLCDVTRSSHVAPETRLVYDHGCKYGINGSKEVHLDVALHVYAPESVAASSKGGKGSNDSRRVPAFIYNRALPPVRERDSLAFTNIGAQYSRFFSSRATPYPPSTASRTCLLIVRPLPEKGYIFRLLDSRNVCFAKSCFL